MNWMHLFEAKVYSGDIYLGLVKANDMSVLKRKASTLCNRYNKAVDTMLVTINSKEQEIRYSRRNKLSPDNKVIRGVWS